MDIVLLHGTTQSPLGWQRLAHVLSERGHASYAVDLSAVGRDAPAAEYVRHACNQLPDLKHPIVVAHSGSGLLLPGIARALGASRQVFLAAWIPDGLHTLMDELVDDATKIFQAEWLGMDPTTDEALARKFLFHDCDDDVADWAITTLRMFVPDAVYREVIPLAGHIPSTVIAPDADRTFHPAWWAEAARRRLGADVVRIPGGHCPQVSRPEQVAEILTS